MPEHRHQRLAQMAARMIAEHGRPMLLLVPAHTGPDYQRVTTWAERPVIGVQSDYQLAEIDGDLVQLEDKQMLIAATDQAVDNTMRLRDHGADYAIIAARVEQPGPVAVLYRLQVRL